MKNLETNSLTSSWNFSKKIKTLKFKILQQNVVLLWTLKKYKPEPPKYKPPSPSHTIEAEAKAALDRLRYGVLDKAGAIDTIPVTTQ